MEPVPAQLSGDGVKFYLQPYKLIYTPIKGNRLFALYSPPILIEKTKLTTLMAG
jgi:hypothetical protein